ncbi:MAG: hypothetical protein QOD46_296, partial [Actinomycetota bacterium]|nr:hypothetical protein [Actinomycetota bacterium]
MRVVGLGRTFLAPVVMMALPVLVVAIGAVEATGRCRRVRTGLAPVEPRGDKRLRAQQGAR